MDFFLLSFDQSLDTSGGCALVEGTNTATGVVVVESWKLGFGQVPLDDFKALILPHSLHNHRDYF